MLYAYLLTYTEMGCSITRFTNACRHISTNTRMAIINVSGYERRRELNWTSHTNDHCMTVGIAELIRTDSSRVGVNGPSNVECMRCCIIMTMTRTRWRWGWGSESAVAATWRRSTRHSTWFVPCLDHRTRTGLHIKSITHRTTTDLQPDVHQASESKVYRATLC